MISSRRLAQMARKWLRAATAGRKRITFRRGDDANAIVLDSDACGAAPLAGKGRFVVYSRDGQRFEVPLAYLKRDIFGELLRMSEDVFGLPGARPITLHAVRRGLCGQRRLLPPEAVVITGCRESTARIRGHPAVLSVFSSSWSITD